ncbi:MAG: hypothetical protein H6594_06575 [Flavobacteriales bacterium]|nr:hypothetical protein [Flavobacteriales bacterium]
MTFKRYVPLQEYTCITSDFAEHIKLRPLTAPVAMGIRQLRFKVSELLAALIDPETCDMEDGAIRGIVVHLGLDPDDQFDVAIQFVCLEPTGAEDTYAYKEPTSYYTVGTDQLIAASGKLSDWLADRGARYTAQVVVRRTDGPAWSAFDHATDPHAVVFPYEGCIQYLIADNHLANGDLLELVCMCEPTSWTDDHGTLDQRGFHHSVVWRGADETLDDTTHTLPFTQKAADLGGTVPPGTHAAIRLPSTGLPRRPGC